MPNFDIYPSVFGNGTPGSPNAGDSLDTIMVGANPMDGGGYSYAVGPDGTGVPYLPKWALDLGLSPAANVPLIQGYTNAYTRGNDIYAGNAVGHVNPASQDGSPDFYYIDPSSWIKVNANTPQFQQAHVGTQSALNGTPYETLDGSGNVTGQKNFEKLFNRDHLSDYMGLVGAALLTGGAAMGAAGAAGAAGGAGAGVGGAGAITGADMAAGAGLGSGAAGASFGGIGAGSAGAGFGLGTLPELGIGGASTFGSAGLGGMAGAGAALSAAASPLASGAGGVGPATGGVEGMPPPSNPFNPASYLDPTNLANMATSGGLSGLLGPAASLIGGLAGSKGVNSSQTQTSQMDPQLQPYIYGSGGLLPQAQGLLNAQMPQAQAAGQQLMTAGTGLLNQPIAGNGVGKVGTNVAGNGYGTVGGNVAGNGFTSGAVKLNAPNTPSNPYLGAMADNISRQTRDLLAQNNLAIQGNAVGVGGLGGSRQGVAQGLAASKAADSLQGNLSSLYGQAYDSDMNRALQQYGMDQGFYANQRGQDLTQSGQDQNFYTNQRNSDIAKAGQDQSFYGSQRGQDLTGASIGAGLLTQGLSTQWSPLQSATSIYEPFSGLNRSVTTSGQQGGGVMGALGGALGGAQLAKNLGLFGNSSGSSGTPPNPFASSWWG